MDELSPSANRISAALRALRQVYDTIDALEKTSVGKLDKKVLRQKYAEGG